MGSAQTAVSGGLGALGGRRWLALMIWLIRAGFADRGSRRSLVDPWVSVGRAGSDSGYGDVSVPGHQAHVARVAGDDGDLAGRR
jgi:hypothetical protein